MSRFLDRICHPGLRLASKPAVCKIQNRNLLEEGIHLLLERLMHRILFDIVVPVVRTFEVHYKGMCHAVLRRGLSAGLHLGQEMMSKLLTCRPSLELSLPPEMRLMYGCCELGARQLSLRARNLAQAWWGGQLFSGGNHHDPDRGLHYLVDGGGISTLLESEQDDVCDGARRARHMREVRRAGREADGIKK